MGIFGGGKKKRKVEVKEKSSWGTIKWVGECPICEKEYSDNDKRDATKKIERCLANCERKEKRAEEEEEERQRRQLATTAREMRKLAKNKKCPFCNSRPCKGTKAKCAAVKAAEWESSHSLDMGDPATFDKQLKWYKDNME